MRFAAAFLMSAALTAGPLVAGAARSQDAGTPAPVADSGSIAAGPSLVHGQPQGPIVMTPHGPAGRGFVFPAAPHGMTPFHLAPPWMQDFAGLDPTELDADGDGEVTIDEIQAARLKQFAEIDANGDGRADAAEVLVHLERREAERRRRQAEWLASWLDTNNDGAISAEEFVASLSHPFGAGMPGAALHFRRR